MPTVLLSSSPTITFSNSIGFSDHKVSTHAGSAGTAPVAGTGKAITLEKAAAEDIVVADNASLDIGTGSFTIEAWVKRPSASGFFTIVGKQAGGDASVNSGYFFRFNDDMLSFAVGTSSASNSVSSGSSIADNEWHHVAAVRDVANQTMSIYIDGKLDASASFSTSYTGSSAAPLGIGWKPNYSAEIFDGSLDEVRIWSTARAQTQLDEYRNVPLTGAETGLVAYWNFEEGSGTAAADRSGHGNTGTVQNGDGDEWADGAISYGVNITAGSPASLRLGGSDLDDQASATALITTLSLHGKLYQTSDGSTKGAQITTVNTLLTDAGGNPRRLVYEADAGYVGTDSFQYQVNDGTNNSANTASVAITVTAPVIAPDANGIIYVDSSVTATGSGNSWATAVKELGDALDAASTLNTTTPGTVKEIWVAKGTYKPILIAGVDGGGGSTTARDKAFVLVKDVKVYGGFAGTEASLDNRDLAKIHTDNETILSGDIGTSGDVSDNVYHVVISAAGVGTALLDGFTVTGGNADGMEGFGNKVNVNGVSIYRSGGGGMSFEESSPTVSHMIFSGNSANSDGGGMEVFNFCLPTLSDIIFEENAATQFGGGLSLETSNVGLSGIIFIRNTAGRSGGGLYIKGSSPSLVNCLFNANHATENGGGISNSANGNPRLTNVTFYNNHADQSGGAFSNETTQQPSIVNSIIWGNSAGAGNPQIYYTTGGAPAVLYSLVQGGYTGGAGITDSDPLFVDPASDDLTLQANSPSVNAGNNGNVSTTTDLAGNVRIQKTKVDLGAYESPYSLPATVTTAAAVNIGATGADLGGSITSNGGGTVTDYGIVWSMASNPTTSDHKVSMGTAEISGFSKPVGGLPAGMLIHYRAYAINEAGTAYGNDKTLSIAVAGFVDVLSFDGIDDYVSIPDDPSLRPADSITLSAWIKPETGGEAFRFIIGKEGPGSDYLFAITSEGKIHGRFHVSGGTGPEGNWPSYQTANAVIAFNQWQYVSVTYDNQTVKVYVNGILQQSFAWNWPLDLAASGTPLTIGIRGSDTTLHFKGEIDEPQVWSKVLSASGIRAAMYKTLNGNEAGLAGYWKFNEGSGTTAYDNSPEGNNGTLINAPQYVVSTIRDFSTNEDTPYSSILPGSDASGAVLSYSLVANGTKGTVSIDDAATGAFTYTPDANAV